MIRGQKQEDHTKGTYRVKKSKHINKNNYKCKTDSKIKNAEITGLLETFIYDLILIKELKCPKITTTSYF